MINFGSTFIAQAPRSAADARYKVIKAVMEAGDLKWSDPKVVSFREKYDTEHPRTFATLQDVADHIDHVVKIAGIQAVGLGSDFDGVGDSLPTDLKDVSMLPNLIEELLKRGYSDDDIESICSKNVLRVWQAVEKFAQLAPKTAAVPN